MAKFLTHDGLQKFWTGVKGKLAGKVDVVEGKGLSTNDLTDELKAQYDVAEKNVVVGVSVNGTALEVGEARTVDVTVPTKTSDITNDSDYTTKAAVAEGYYNKGDIDTKVQELNTAINNGGTNLADNYYNKTTVDGKVSALEEAIAAAAAGKVTISIVDAVPTVETAQANILYFVPREGDTTGDVYDQFMLIDGAIEAVGTTEVDLAGYVKSTDIETVSDAEIDAMLEA
jgi:hypothetical protein